MAKFNKSSAFIKIEDCTLHRRCHLNAHPFYTAKASRHVLIIRAFEFYVTIVPIIRSISNCPGQLHILGFRFVFVLANIS